MRKLIAYPLTCIHLLFFGLTLLIFHPIQWVCLKVGYQAHKKSVSIMNLFLVRSLHFLGARIHFNNSHKIATNTPIIVVANHQSLHDIPPIIWFMRKHHPKFISKKELGKGIPSVSYNLRHGGSVLIDRKKPLEAIEAIKNFGNYIETNNRAAIIFPEGTRSKDGAPRKFQTKGFLTLLKKIPSAVVVPITINNSWKLYRYGKFPMGIGANITFTIHKPLVASDYNNEELIRLVETQIKEAIINE